MKKYSLLIIALVLVAGLFLFQLSTKKNQPLQQTDFTCQTKEMVYYFHPSCHWCQQVEKDKTVEKLERAGVKVQKVDVSKEVPKHQFDGVPTFVIDDKVYPGYRTLDDLKKLLNCTP